MKIVSLPFERERDVPALARRSRLLGALADLPQRQRNNLGKAVSEVCRDILAHGGHGTVQFAIGIAGGEQRVEVEVCEEPQSITDLRKPTQARRMHLESSINIRRARTLVDHISLEPPGEKLVVRLAQMIPAHVEPFQEHEIAAWASALDQDNVEEALAITQRRSRTLAKQVSELGWQERLHAQLQQDTSTDNSATFLSLVASKTDNAVMILQQEGAVTWTNDALARMTGYSSAEVIGKKPTQFLFGTESDQESVENLKRALQNGHSIDEEFLLYRADGQKNWALLSFTPVQDNQGNLARWIVIGFDTTRRRQAQEAMRAAKKAAEAANEAKSQFLANMSHEIRTPMNAIIGMTELALNSGLTPEQQEYLETVKASSRSLLNLLNDILDLSKIEAGKMHLEQVNFDLVQLIRETLAALSVKATAKELTLESRVSSDVPRRVRGDPMRLGQVLLNLVDNAIKFTERGQVVVGVKTQWITDDQVSLLFSVSDSGIGISPDQRDSIFEAFTQDTSAPTNRLSGTGLGLTITAELLHLMHGRIWFESEVGRGSEFQFSLRLELASSADTSDLASLNEQVESSDEEIQDSHPSESLRILVADDDRASRTLTSTILQQRGHRCEQVTNGPEVLAAIDQEHFDIVVMDLRMPKLGGLETTALIRERERDSDTHLPIIALTAHAMKEDRESCLLAGMDAYLSKPVHARELYTLAESICSVTPVKKRATSEKDSAVNESQFEDALRRLEGDVELLREQMTFFIEDAPHLLAEIRRAASHSDFKALRISAHRLKGLVAGFDAVKATDLALKLEYMGRENQLDNAKTTVAQLQTEVDHLIAELGRFIAVN